MSDMSSIANRLLEYFHGLNRAYGECNLQAAPSPGEKAECRYRTVYNAVDVDLWKAHLAGKKSIGIIPINDQNKCHFGAIDIDIYTDEAVKDLVEKVERHSLPLIPCKSKSGGIHLYVFLNAPIKASALREKLGYISCLIGYGSSEIFPKQNTVAAGKGEVGSLINMPYYKGNDTSRYALSSKGDRLNVSEFLKRVSEVILSPKDFIDLPLTKYSAIDGLEGCPPCIEAMCQSKVGSGKRNEALLAIAIYLKKRGTGSSDELQEYNHRYMDPPVSINEVVIIWKSVEKKEYGYPCKRPPCKDYCDRKECAKRLYGYKSGIDDSLPFTLNALTKYDTVPPIWFVDVDGYEKRLELSTEALQKQHIFQAACMTCLNMMPPIVKEPVWREAINALLQSVTVIPAPDNSTPEGLCKEYIREFCLSDHRATSCKDDILLGSVYTDKEGHWFRARDVMAFLEAQKFKEYRLHNITSILKKLGGEDKVMPINGSSVSVWKLPLYLEDAAIEPKQYDSPM